MKMATSLLYNHIRIFCK